jgi:hypothetical protein
MYIGHVELDCVKTVLDFFDQNTEHMNNGMISQDWESAQRFLEQ